MTRAAPVLLTFVVFAGGAFSQADATEVFQGSVVSAGGHRISIERPNRSVLVFHLAPGASVTRDARIVKLEQLKQNDRATVTTDNRIRAIIVSVRSVRADAGAGGRVRNADVMR